MVTPEHKDAAPPSTAIRFPIRILAVALVLTTATFGWLGWIMLDVHRDVALDRVQSARMEELQGVVRHVGEVLGGSTRLAVTTGDPAWEARYRRFEPQLAAAITEVEEYAASRNIGAGAAGRTAHANTTLTAMEYRAFALVRAGRVDEARAVVFSPAYEREEQAFAEGSASFIGVVRRDIAARLRRDERTGILSMVGAVVVLGFAFSAWLWVVRSLRRWRAELEHAVSERERAEHALRQAHDELESRVEQRTTELRVLFDLMPAMIWFKDTQNGILRVNRRAAEAVGMAVEEIEGRPSIEVYPKAAKFYVDDVEVIQSGLPKLGIVETIRNRQGEEIWIQTDKVPYRDHAGKVVGLVVMAQDITQRRRAEESLRLLGSAVEQSNESITITDAVFTQPGPRIVFVNPAFTTMTGYTAEEAIRQPVRLLYGPRTDQTVLGRVRQQLEQGEVCDVETINYRKDGEEIILESHIAPIRDATGLVTNLVAVQRDITARRRMESALRESDEKFHQLAAHITDAFWIRSPDMRELHYVSPAFERIWGRSVESLHAHPEQWTDFILPEDQARVLGEFASLTGDARSVDVQYRIVRPDGEIRTLRVRGFQVRDAADKLIRHAGIVTDITESHRAAEELRESDRRFRDMLRHLELVSMMLDRNGCVTYCNDYLLGLTGWRIEEVMGQDWFDLFLPPELGGEVRGVHARLLADQSVAWHHENEIVTKTGARRLIRWNNSVLRSAAGEVMGTASIGEDVTERTRLEAQLLESQRMETVGKLAGGVAHEFNSILTAILGFSELLVNELSVGSPLVFHATEIGKAAQRAATLTRQLLAFGRKQVLRPEVLDLNAVLARMESTVRLVMGRNVDVRLVTAPGLRSVLADASQIEQVIINMVMNAADAMPKGGTLTLETANVTLDQEYVRSVPDLTAGEYAMLAITDSGTGMSDDVRERVFEPFFSTKPVGHGTGLGLSTCHGIIHQSGGHISVSAELGRGSTFRVYLPQHAPRTAVPADRRDSSDLPGGTETVLLVESDATLREMATTVLGRLGYTILAAADASDALTLTQGSDIGHIDVVFTDIDMPQMSGAELFERVRKSSPHAGVLFASARGKNAVVDHRVLKDGASFLQRPFTPSALARKIRDVLDQSTAPLPDAAHQAVRDI
jgi:PAS domain S-box-containing protein